MAMKNIEVAKDVDEYIRRFPAGVQVLLHTLRKTIKDAAPQAAETISYQMPAYKQQGILFYFAGYKKHIGFYPASNKVLLSFKEQVAAFNTSKGTLQFPLDKPLPLKLITDIVKFRMLENEEKILEQKSVKPSPKKASKAHAGKVSINKIATVPAKKLTKPTDIELVQAWMDKQEPGVRNEIEAVRSIILKTDTQLAERIKWNAPSYHYYKQDIVTFGPCKKDKILLVFHHPAVVRTTSALLQGDYKDRRLVYFKNKAEALKNKKELTRIITEIITIINDK